jgi:hypothetical protein
VIEGASAPKGRLESTKNNTFVDCAHNEDAMKMKFKNLNKQISLVGY